MFDLAGYTFGSGIVSVPFSHASHLGGKFTKTQRVKESHSPARPPCRIFGGILILTSHFAQVSSHSKINSTATHLGQFLLICVFVMPRRKTKPNKPPARVRTPVQRLRTALSCDPVDIGVIYEEAHNRGLPEEVRAACWLALLGITEEDVCFESLLVF